MIPPTGYRSKGKGRSRKVYPVFNKQPHRKMAVASIVNGHTNREMNRLFNEPDYQVFVRNLGKAAEDPKVKAVLMRGLQDGLKRDDIIRTKHAVNQTETLQPIQSEIDLSKSLSYLGKNPKNVPKILRGETLGPSDFGGNDIVTSKDSYIVDGHHRWSQVYMINPEAKVESIDLNVENPRNALVASQVAIAGSTGKVSMRHVEEGKNIYKMPVGRIEEDMKTYFTPDFYNAFYQTAPDQFKSKDDVHNHILANILRMRIKSKPATDISRADMPVFDDVNAQGAANKLSRGEINIHKPFVKERT